MHMVEFEIKLIFHLMVELAVDMLVQLNIASIMVLDVVELCC